LTDVEFGLFAAGDYIAYALVARNKGIGEAWERGHATIPQQPLGARADAGPLDLYNAICAVGLWQLDGP
jgi:hypothetical protein